MASLPFIVIDIIDTLFTTDEQYQQHKEFLIGFAEQHPKYGDHIRSELDLADRIREAYRSDPELLERIRQRIIQRMKERELEPDDLEDIVDDDDTEDERPSPLFEE